jgi:hypothetical protein
LFENAVRISARVALPSSVLDVLYRNRRDTDVARDAWEREIRIACALDLLTRDFFKGRGLGNLSQFMDQQAVHEAQAKLHPSGGTLFLTFHGGFVVMARKLFSTLFHDGISIQNHRSSLNLSAKLDPAAALFNALRALQEKKSVIMSPDGPYGKHSCAMHVLGRRAEMADGAAFLAYEAKCDTAWFTVVRDDNGFLPDIQLGPRREDGERYGQFQQRLCDFYGERIDALYSGDPRNIALSKRWVGHFRRIRESLGDHG